MKRHSVWHYDSICCFGLLVIQFFYSSLVSSHIIIKKTPTKMEFLYFHYWNLKMCVNQQSLWILSNKRDSHMMQHDLFLFCIQINMLRIFNCFVDVDGWRKWSHELYLSQLKSSSSHSPHSIQINFYNSRISVEWDHFHLALLSCVLWKMQFLDCFSLEFHQSSSKLS